MNNNDLGHGASTHFCARRTWSLSLVVAVQTGLVIALAMTVYAVYQRLSLPEVTLKELLLRHLWHAAVLGVLIYLCSWAVFRWTLWRTLNALYVHIYALSKGDLRPLNLKTRISEMSTIIDGVNLLVRQIQRTQSQDLIAEARIIVAEIRKMAAAEESGPQAFPLLALLDELEARISALAHAPVNTVQDERRAPEESTM